MPWGRGVGLGLDLLSFHAWLCGSFCLCPFLHFSLSCLSPLTAKCTQFFHLSVSVCWSFLLFSPPPATSCSLSCYSRSSPLSPSETVPVHCPSVSSPLPPHFPLFPDFWSVLSSILFPRPPSVSVSVLLCLCPFVCMFLSAFCCCLCPSGFPAHLHAL